MKSKNILLVNQSAGYLMLDIVNAFALSKSYTNIVLFAGQINVRPTVPAANIKIIKTIRYNNKNLFTRFISWFVSFIHLLLIILFRYNKYELFLVSNPPLTTFIPLFSRNPFSLLIYDIFPDTLVTQKIIKKSSFINTTWVKINKIVFRKAKQIFTISKDMQGVISQYVDAAKISVIYNWAHNEHLKPIAKKENIFLQKHDMTHKFIVLYSGNMGMTHDIEVLTDVAEKLKYDQRIQFIFIGEGVKKTVIENQIRNLNLNNCLLLPFQDLRILPFSFGAADVSVVTTDANQTSLSVPSKTYSYMSVGSAFLCLADKYSELGKMVESENIGKCFDKNEIDAMATYILELANDKDKLKLYKNHSRQLSFMYTPENANKFVEILSQ